jgi:hypothetical protein
VQREIEDVEHVTGRGRERAPRLDLLAARVLVRDEQPVEGLAPGPRADADLEVAHLHRAERARGLGPAELEGEAQAQRPVGLGAAADPDRALEAPGRAGLEAIDLAAPAPGERHPLAPLVEREDVSLVELAALERDVYAEHAPGLRGGAEGPRGLVQDGEAQA